MMIGIYSSLLCALAVPALLSSMSPKPDVKSGAQAEQWALQTRS